jgi:prevent-host-death family protein
MTSRKHLDRVGVPLDQLAKLAKLLGVAKIVNMHEAKTNLSRLVEEAEAGEAIILARAGKPVAKLVPVRRSRRRRLGHWKGRVVMSEDFDAPLPADVLATWEGRR